MKSPILADHKANSGVFRMRHFYPRSDDDGDDDDDDDGEGDHADGGWWVVDGGWWVPAPFPRAP